MRTKKIIIALGVSFGLTIGSTAQASSPFSPSIPKYGLSLIENGGLTSMSSAIYGSDTVNWSDNSQWKLCGEITSPICTQSALVQVNNFLPTCSSSSDLNCISSVWAEDSSGKRILGTIGNRVPAMTNGDYSAVPSMNLPAGIGQGTIFTIPGVQHSGKSDSYLVLARDFYSIIKNNGELATNKKYEVNNIHAGIVPVSEVRGNYKAGYLNQIGYGGGNNGPTSTPSGDSCQVTDEGLCYVGKDFPQNYQFGMTIRLANKVIGWFDGRIHSPSITTKNVGSGEELTIQAEPVRVNSLDFLADTNLLSQATKDLIFDGTQWGMIGGQGGIKINMELNKPEAIKFFTLFNPIFKDTSSGERTFWTFESMVPGGPDVQQSPVGRCTNNTPDLVGVVTTNSLLYSSGPPTFNRATSSLDYQLASPHFESSGDVTQGSYDLLIRGDVARCIYGFSKAPVTASISVISNDGSAKTATTVLGERNGWLYLSAQGFQFSSPTIRVTLKQDQISDNPVSKSQTITCVKGKLTKSITSLKPNCPSGYRKK